jgi:hypothetical protein
MRTLQSILFAAFVSSFFTGCVIPWPHRSVRSPEASGRVIDVVSHQPVSGAQVFAEGRPETTITTDRSGSFHLPARRNFHLFYIGSACSTSWPRGEPFTDMLGVVHPDYERAGTRIAPEISLVPLKR